MWDFICFICGEGGIRTHDTLASIQTFQACSFGHSDTSPESGCKCNKVFSLSGYFFVSSPYDKPKSC